MLKIIITSTVMFLLSFTATGQTSNTKLRDHLNLPLSTAIIQPDTSNLPAGTTFKVYIATGKHKKTFKRFAKWMDQWNQQEGLKYGKLEIVSALSDADVILARFNIREFIPRSKTTISVGPVHDPLSDRNAASPKISTRQYMPIAQYSYLLTRTPDALIIIYDNVDRSHISDYSDPDKNLFNEFKERLKNR